MKIWLIGIIMSKQEFPQTVNNEKKLLEGEPKFGDGGSYVCITRKTTFYQKLTKM